MQDAGGVPGGVLAEVHGHILELRVSLQLLHEDLLYLIDLPYHLRNEIQEAILPGKC